MQASDRAGGDLLAPPLKKVVLQGDFLVGKASGGSGAIEWKLLPEVENREVRSKKNSVRVATRFGSGNRSPYERVIADPLPVAPPKARNQPVVKLIADHRFRNLCSEEETILELYHANLSMHQLAALVDQFWGEKLGLSDVAKRYNQAVGEIEAWCGRPITRAYR